MRGLVFEGPGRVVFRGDLPDPHVEHRTDAVVAVSLAGLCGSDLHPYLGREPARSGVISGHEAVGVVVEAGSDVAHLLGHRVIVPFSTSCGTCPPCRTGLSSRCRSGALFGWGDPAGDRTLDGCQAEKVLVPHAVGSLVPVPDAVSDRTALLLSDNFPTGWYAVERSGLDQDGRFVVVGLGSVGLCAVTAAFALGAAEVVAIDPVPERRMAAAAHGAETFEPGHRIEPASAVVDATGVEAGQRLAFEATAPGGALSVIAVPTGERFAFTPVEAYDRNLTVRTGRAPVRSLLERLLPPVAAGEVTPPDVLSHVFDLEDGPDVYRRFAERGDGIVKAAFTPSRGDAAAR